MINRVYADVSAAGVSTTLLERVNLTTQDSLLIPRVNLGGPALYVEQVLQLGLHLGHR